MRSYLHQMAAVRAFAVTWGRMLFGTDLPAMSRPAICETTGRDKNYTGFSAEDRVNVKCNHAKKWVPESLLADR